MDHERNGPFESDPEPARARHSVHRKPQGMTLLSDLPDGTAELFRPEFIAVDAL